jgi:hypothetical protein
MDDKSQTGAAQDNGLRNQQTKKRFKMMGV